MKIESLTILDHSAVNISTILKDCTKLSTLHSGEDLWQWKECTTLKYLACDPTVGTSPNPTSTLHRCASACLPSPPNCDPTHLLALRRRHTLVYLQQNPALFMFLTSALALGLNAFDPMPEGLLGLTTLRPLLPHRNHSHLVWAPPTLESIHVDMRGTHGLFQPWVSTSSPLPS